jgi:hypothetical protein
MTQYRIVLLAENGRELSSGYLFTGDNDSACASAQQLMRSNPEAVAVRVLQDHELICSYERA